MRRLSCGFLGGLAITACSSNYIPRSPGRVAIILDTGQPTYVRDGVKYPHGFFGGGLIDAVAGNAPAEAAAHEYRSRLGTGVLVGLIGAMCAPVALGIAVARESSNIHNVQPEL